MQKRRTGKVRLFSFRPTGRNGVAARRAAGGFRRLRAAGNMRLRGAGALRLAKSRPAGGCSHARSLRLAKRGETKFSPLLRIIPFPSKWEQAVKRLPEDLRHLLP